MAENVDQHVSEVLQNLARHINCLSEENRNTRKRAIDGIKKEVLNSQKTIEGEVLQKILDEILKPLLKLFSDPVEKCREHSIVLVTGALKKTSNPDQYLHYIIPVMVQRLGQQDVTETSEELRLQLVELLTEIVKQNNKKISVYLDDMIKILQRTIVDPYPEVKKESCRCTSVLAKAIPEYFHMQSESLVQPLLTEISHRHARVRVAVIDTIGDVLQYGNGKNVDDVVSHLAQRLFDQFPSVRAAVTKIVGMWLLDLRDRYSFHHKLIPLLLTSITDEMPDIQQQAADLWHDVGIKYEGENEDDLKDKQDFIKPEPEHYPSGVERPNLGCRTLVYRNLSKIMPGLIKDMSDWVAETRVKSANLMYTLLINAEENTTQHMDKLIPGLCKACADDEEQVVKMVSKCAEMVGYFVRPEVWCKLVLKNVKLSQTFGPLMVLAGIMRGTAKADLVAYIQDICNILCNPDITHVADGSCQWHLLCCIEALIGVAGDSCSTVVQELFVALVTIQALQKDQRIPEKVNELLTKLAATIGLEDKQQLYEAHTRAALATLQGSYAHWSKHSLERLVFDSLLMECGPVVGEILEDIMPVLVTNLDPEKDPEVRLKIFSLLSRLMMNAGNTLNSKQRFGDFSVAVIRDMILPNCVWKAGRVAAAIRTTAVSSLWALFQSGILTKEKLQEVSEALLTQLLTTLEDDSQSTRLVTCRVLTQIFSQFGDTLDHDRLHQQYPELLKRLDDSSDDIRVEVSRTFTAYLSCLEGNYDVNLYRLHLESIYKGLLLHLDDPEQKIQEAVLGILKKAAAICPQMLMKEIESVKHKHRSTKYCDALAQFTATLTK